MLNEGNLVFVEQCLILYRRRDWLRDKGCTLFKIHMLDEASMDEVELRREIWSRRVLEERGIAQNS